MLVKILVRFTLCHTYSSLCGLLCHLVLTPTCCCLPTQKKLDEVIFVAAYFLFTHMCFFIFFSTAISMLQLSLWFQILLYGLTSYLTLCCQIYVSLCPVACVCRLTAPKKYAVLDLHWTGYVVARNFFMLLCQKIIVLHEPVALLFLFVTRNFSILSCRHLLLQTYK